MSTAAYLKKIERRSDRHATLGTPWTLTIHILESPHLLIVGATWQPQLSVEVTLALPAAPHVVQLSRGSGDQARLGPVKRDFFGGSKDTRRKCARLNE